MKELNEKKVNLQLADVEAKIIYHFYEDVEVDTLLVSFKEKRRVISTLEGYREVPYVANTYTPVPLQEQMMENYCEYMSNFPLSLGLKPSELAFLNTGVDIDNLAMCERSYEEFKVCCLATAGAKDNAMRSGVDTTSFVERDGQCENVTGTVNLILLTNATLSEGAMTRAIITATEAKTAAFQELDIKSVYSPQHQATGTGTDNMIIVSGTMGKPLKVTSGHSKMSELIAHSTKTAVAQALKNFGL